MSDATESTGDATGDGFDRRQFLTAAGALGAAFAAGVGVGVTLSGGTGLPLVGGGGREPVTLGAVYPDPGPAAPLGPGAVAEAALAVQQANEAGGIDGRTVELVMAIDEETKSLVDDRDLLDVEHVELVVADGGSTPGDVVERLAAEFGVQALFGLSSSAGALEAAPTIQAVGLPFVLTDVGTPFLTEPDTDTYGDYYASDDGTAAARPNLFRTGANLSINTYAMARFADENLDVTRVANLGPDTVYGRQAWAYFRAYANGLGADYEYVGSAFTPAGTDDMSAGIGTILDASPELVFTSFRTGDAVTFVRQAVERGLFEEVVDVFDTLGADPRVFGALDETMPEGVHYSSWYWYTAFDNRHNDAFVEDWKTTYYLPTWHEDESSIVNLPAYSGASAWAAVFLYRQAMEAAGGTRPEAVIAQLEGATFEKDPRGPTTVDPESHQATAPAVIGETAPNDEVFYGGSVGIGSPKTYTLDRSTASELLDGSGLPPGV